MTAAMLTRERRMLAAQAQGLRIARFAKDDDFGRYLDALEGRQESTPPVASADALLKALG